MESARAGRALHALKGRAAFHEVVYPLTLGVDHVELEEAFADWLGNRWLEDLSDADAMEAARVLVARFGQGS